MNNIKEIPISLSPDYVSHWGTWEAVRELIQNAFDSNEYEYYLEDDDLKIITRDGKIPTKALLLGNSAKRNDDTKIGVYGEGLKLALVVLLRENKGVSIVNGNDLWTPIFDHSEIFEGECLKVIVEEDCFPGETDVVITISGLNWDEIEEIESNLVDLNGEGKERIFLESDRGCALLKLDSDGEEVEDDYIDDGANVFVNGLFISRVPGNYKYDYSFKPGILSLDRDRNTVRDWELQYEATRLIASSNRPEVLAELSLSNYNDVASYSKSSYYHTYDSDEKAEELKKIATKGFIEKYSDKAFPIDLNWDENKKLMISNKVISVGKTPVSVSHGLYCMIGENYKIDEKLKELFEFEPIKYLSNFLFVYEPELGENAKKDLEETVSTLKMIKGE